jgi:hypothetical protein
MTIWRMRIACWVTKATDTLSQFVIIIAFPLQKWLRKRTSILRYTSITSPVTFIKCKSHFAKLSSLSISPISNSHIPLAAYRSLLYK